MQCKNALCPVVPSNLHWWRTLWPKGGILGKTPMKSQSIALPASKLTFQGDSSHKKKKYAVERKSKSNWVIYQHQQCRAHHTSKTSILAKKNELIDLWNGVNQMSLVPRKVPCCGRGCAGTEDIWGSEDKYPGKLSACPAYHVTPDKYCQKSRFFQIYCK